MVMFYRFLSQLLQLPSHLILFPILISWFLFCNGYISQVTCTVFSMFSIWWVCSFFSHFSLVLSIIIFTCVLFLLCLFLLHFGLLFFSPLCLHPPILVLLFLASLMLPNFFFPLIFTCSHLVIFFLVTPFFAKCSFFVSSFFSLVSLQGYIGWRLPYCLHLMYRIIRIL